MSNLVIVSALVDQMGCKPLVCSNLAAEDGVNFIEGTSCSTLSLVISQV